MNEARAIERARQSILAELTVEGQAHAAELTAGTLRRIQAGDAAEHEWLATRLEAFARYLREAWARGGSADLVQETELRADGWLLRLGESWWSPKSKAQEDAEHRGHGCSRDPESPEYVSPLAG